MMLHLLEHDERFEAPRSPRESRDQTAGKMALVLLAYPRQALYAGGCLLDHDSNLEQRLSIAKCRCYQAESPS